MDYKTLYEESQKQIKKLKSQLMSLKELLYADIPKMKREQDMKEAYWVCWSAYALADDPKTYFRPYRGSKMPDKEFVDSWCEDREPDEYRLYGDVDDLKSYLYGEFMIDEEDEEEVEWDPDEYGECECCNISMTEDDFNNGAGLCESCVDFRAKWSAATRS